MSKLIYESELRPLRAGKDGVLTAAEVVDWFKREQERMVREGLEALCRHLVEMQEFAIAQPEGESLH